jgi:hypothetical protein
MQTNSATEGRVAPGRPRRGQAAVETMMLAFMVMVILMCMFHLFTVTWASQNAHIRAREALLHGHTYMQGDRVSYSQANNELFDGNNYTKADRNGTIDFTAGASDQTRDDFIGAKDINITATITEF